MPGGVTVGKAYQVVFGRSPEGELGGAPVLGFLPLGRGRTKAPRPPRGHDWAKRARNKARRQAIKAQRRGRR